MLGRLKRLWRALSSLSALGSRFDHIELPAKSDYKHPKVLTGTLLAKLNIASPAKSLRDVEFQVFSQFGDDGIIQYLMHSLGVAERTFVEFGVETYVESNTRFLLVKDKWSGLVLDGRASNIDYIRKDLVSTFFNVEAKEAFITAENINTLLSEAGMTGRIGLLSVDIDGVDYWIWKAINVIDPAVVVVEYNSGFGSERAVTVPYAPDFQREAAHPSRLYWGASLEAFRHLAQQKGYVFVGCNGNGNNAYFVRAEYAEHPFIKSLTPAYQEGVFTEYTEKGQRIRGRQSIEVVRGMPVVNVVTGEAETL